MFSTPPNLVDLLMVTVLILSASVLVNFYLNEPGWSKSFRSRVLIFGILWICFGLVSEDLLEATGLFERMDSWAHARLGTNVAMGLVPHFWDTIPSGNKAYGAYLSLVFTIGAYVPGARALNAFLGFWGGLALASNLRPFLSFEKHRELLMTAFIFFPSTVFWTSNNLKEGLTYWGIALIFSAALPAGPRRTASALLLVPGIVTAGLMRPHVCLAAISSVATINLFRRGRTAFAILALAVVPFLFLKMQDLAHNEFTSVEDVSQYLEVQRAGLLRISGQSAHREESKIPVVSGLVNIFFRPFPWESRSFFMTCCALEIWTLTGTLIWSWVRLTSRERSTVLKVPAVQATLMFLALMSVLFSYLPNDGLLARQRVQVVPALMILTALPFGAKSGLRRAAMPRRMPLVSNRASCKVS